MSQRRFTPPPTKFPAPSVQRSTSAGAPPQGTRAPPAPPPVRFGTLQAKIAPAAVRHGVVQRAEEAPAKRPRRAVRLTEIQLDQTKAEMANVWSSQNRAGTQDDSLAISSTGAHACAARAHLADGSTIAGNFSSDDYHAEMDVLANVVANGNRLADIAAIEIEKEPCPRCAVVLNRLGLADLVTYKKVGQKDYPTWRFPGIAGTVWATVMGAGNLGSELDREALLTYFRTNKWW